MGTRAGISALVLLGLLAVVALASGGSRPLGGEAGPGRAPPPVFWDYLFSTAAVLVVLGVPFALWLLVLQSRGSAGGGGKQRDILVLVAVAALCVGLALGARVAADRDGPSLRGQPAQTGLDDTARPGEAGRREAEFRWLPAIAIGGGLLLAVLYLQAKRRLRGELEAERSEEALVDALAALLEDTLEDLRREPDLRRAVITAYARMERALAAFGHPRRAFEAPLEYLGRVAPELTGVAAAPQLLFELTQLYERARFSPHEVDARMKEDAIATLAALRAGLLEPAA